jgi:hypothetical protein
MKLFRILAIAALAMVSSVSAQAGAITGVVLSNLGSDGDTHGPLAGSWNVNGTTSLALGFTTGAADFKLNQFNAALFGITSGTVSATMTIYESNSGKPGTFVGSATIPSIGNDDAYTFDFAPAGGLILTANKTYFAVATTTGTSSSWYFNGPAPTTFAPGGVSYLNTIVTSDSGSNWTQMSPGLNAFFAIAGTPVPPAAVPEPALTSLLCLSGIALIRRRMKK